MRKIFIPVIFSFFAIQAAAQNNPVNKIKYDQPYGVIDTADLTMKECDFEKDANAEVLFDVQKVVSKASYITNERHIRIKIFSEAGKRYGVLKIPLRKGGRFYDEIKNIKAETINLNGRKIEYTPLDNSGIYTEKKDENGELLCIAMPAVKIGSVMDITYNWMTTDPRHFPQWSPQTDLPARFSQLNYIYGDVVPVIRVHISQPFVGDTSATKDANLYIRHIWMLTNIRSFTPEPYMGFKEDNLQYIAFDGYTSEGSAIVRGDIFNRFIKEIDTRIMPDSVAKNAKSMARDDKIAYIYNYVKNNMAWNKHDGMYIPDGVGKAWAKKTGNSLEVNLALCSMLKQAGIKCWPMVLATHDYYKLNLNNLFVRSFNRTVVFVPVDATRNYVLDATSKYNNYQQTPADLLDLEGVLIDAEDKEPLHVVSTIDNRLSIETTFVNAQIDPTGKMTGQATITSYSYFKKNVQELHEALSDETYKKFLLFDNNGLRITAIQFEDDKTDTLPVVQNIRLEMGLEDSGDGYMYFKPDMFWPQPKNPFTNENRISDIYFGYRKLFNITGNYKIPAGYKVDAIPKNTTILMPDSSITFRLVSGIQEDGTVQIRYTLQFRRSSLPQAEYPALYKFYRKMYEALDEHVVLKKS